MQAPPCGGPGPHRRDFEEMFTILEGEIEFKLTTSSVMPCSAASSRAVPPV